MILPWAYFKQVITEKGKVQYVEDASKLYLVDANFRVSCEIRKTLELDDYTDYTTNYASLCIPLLSMPFDKEGTTVIRHKAAQKGWTIDYVCIEAKTSTLTITHAKDQLGTNIPGITCSVYDNSDTLITTEEGLVNAVKTVVDIELEHDFELAAGECCQKASPASDVRIWAVVAPDIPYVSGGSRAVIEGYNLAYKGQGIAFNIESLASKYLTYSATYHTNKVRIIVKHNAGVAHDVMIALKIYKA